MKIRFVNLDDAFYTLGFFARTIRGIGNFVLRGGAAYKVLTLQILFTFVEALGIASLLALGIGAAVYVIGMPLLLNLSQPRLIYSLLIIIITRELGPLLAAFIIIARSATAIATEIGGMVISHEVEAYIAVGVDPIEYLAVPRFLGVTVSMFLLNIYFSVFGLAGSYGVVRIFNPLPAEYYFSSLFQALTIHDISISIIKSICFGMIIAVLAISNGFSVERASTEIPIVGLKSVGSSFAWCIIVDILLSALYYTALS
ncbi:ABC transporter permease protein [Treponema primitia ZAS-2]|uniref:ABC transporter permease protein n=1 Tax=Treponema primitia (strain ATCC BAA-887 / DSM 12427 / ZAS-2) TaxID=545694 RepID=F5YJ99_TREPZ|nr:ABC transporter permease [Treponema primitia]AEF85865.1 ABC transporter permease protein [Treponema primitia ZAS-2]